MHFHQHYYLLSGPTDGRTENTPSTQSLETLIEQSLSCYASFWLHVCTITRQHHLGNRHTTRENITCPTSMKRSPHWVGNIMAAVGFLLRSLSMTFFLFLQVFYLQFQLSCQLDNWKNSLPILLKWVFCSSFHPLCCTKFCV